MEESVRGKLTEIERRHAGVVDEAFGEKLERRLGPVLDDAWDRSADELRDEVLEAVKLPQALFYRKNLPGMIRALERIGVSGYDYVSVMAMARGWEKKVFFRFQSAHPSISFRESRDSPHPFEGTGSALGGFSIALSRLHALPLEGHRSPSYAAGTRGAWLRIEDPLQFLRDFYSPDGPQYPKEFREALDRVAYDILREANEKDILSREKQKPDPDVRTWKVLETRADLTHKGETFLPSPALEVDIPATDGSLMNSRVNLASPGLFLQRRSGLEPWENFLEPEPMENYVPLQISARVTLRLEVPLWQLEDQIEFPGRIPILRGTLFVRGTPWDLPRESPKMLPFYPTLPGDVAPAHPVRFLIRDLPYGPLLDPQSEALHYAALKETPVGPYIRLRVAEVFMDVDSVLARVDAGLHRMRMNLEAEGRKPPVWTRSRPIINMTPLVVDVGGGEEVEAGPVWMATSPLVRKRIALSLKADQTVASGIVAVAKDMARDAKQAFRLDHVLRVVAGAHPEWTMASARAPTERVERDYDRHIFMDEQRRVHVRRLLVEASLDSSPEQPLLEAATERALAVKEALYGKRPIDGLGAQPAELEKRGAWLYLEMAAYAEPTIDLANRTAMIWFARDFGDGTEVFDEFLGALQKIPSLFKDFKMQTEFLPRTIEVTPGLPYLERWATESEDLDDLLETWWNPASEERGVFTPSVDVFVTRAILGKKALLPQRELLEIWSNTKIASAARSLRRGGTGASRSLVDYVTVRSRYGRRDRSEAIISVLNFLLAKEYRQVGLGFHAKDPSDFKTLSVREARVTGKFLRRYWREVPLGVRKAIDARLTRMLAAFPKPLPAIVTENHIETVARRMRAIEHSGDLLLMEVAWTPGLDAYVDALRDEKSYQLTFDLASPTRGVGPLERRTIKASDLHRTGRDSYHVIFFLEDVFYRAEVLSQSRGLPLAARVVPKAIGLIGWDGGSAKFPSVVRVDVEDPDFSRGDMVGKVAVVLPHLEGGDLTLLHDVYTKDGTLRKIERVK